MSATLTSFHMPGFRAPAANNIQIQKGVSPELILPQHGIKGGKRIGSSKSSYAAWVPETFDALKKLEMFGMLPMRCEEGGPQLLRGSEIGLASARLFLGFSPTVSSVSRLARK